MLSSRKAEERNEKIIRGLMKLPPNRKCINCNTPGPQYVCTSFWTFVCMICSGVHREFTHRVKSVSLSKFTSQEVEALQRGGNQRARETFLNDWDPLRHRFPAGSNADKIREFIKNVYVNRRYAAGKTSEKPLRILQLDHKSHGDMPRKASSYHSFSQSPPYDYQYEERRYGKHAISLIRKAGSDQGLKSSRSFSPSRLANPVNEENFADEHSNSRSSNYSTSSASSPYRSNYQSPSTQRAIKFSSSSTETSRERVNMWNQKVNTFSDTNTNLDEGRAPHPQRKASNSSFASFSSSTRSFNSVISESASGTKKDSGAQCKSTTNLSLSSSSVSRNHDSTDLFNSVFASQTVTSSTSDSDLCVSPETKSSLPIDLLSSDLPTDLFQPSSTSLISTASCPELSLAPQPLSSDHKQSLGTLNETSLDLVNPKNSIWATFDGPQNMDPSQGSQSFTGAAITFNEGGSVSDAHQHLFQNTTQQWNAFYDYSAQLTYPSMPMHWHGSQHNSVTLTSGSNQVGALLSTTHRTSTNPFDIAYESADLELSNMFLDTSSMHGVLPNGQIPTAFSDGVTNPWFTQNSVATYVPTGPQGSFGLFGMPVPNTQLAGVSSNGSVAVGGNPFA
ncbi:putative ADP-ribosylation factor GTPase-activating protein AGD14 [Heracleum sosnowskyi]|uniref:ADP-ribosylation factor GTPase-activating protein AGD14 n=1 Tax=Heracleum sosnowskyi TaxID=360622 RepID=A0AAD8N3N2_9APIA|nr:putative ADP-ribosylation factor GTPase-activating protein AGD14 [Heracleum sosnowskyi]